MDKRIFFTERQRFKQWWLWLILLGLNGLFLFGVFRQVILAKQFGDNPMSNAGLLTASGISIILTLLFVILRLDTVIKEDGVYVRIFPLQLKFKHYAWNDLTKSFVRQYAPIAEFGGWGMRLGLFGRGKAITISGNSGLQLECKNKDKLLIGTNKPEELSGILIQMGQLKE